LELSDLRELVVCGTSHLNESVSNGLQEKLKVTSFPLWNVKYLDVPDNIIASAINYKSTAWGFLLSATAADAWFRLCEKCQEAQQIKLGVLGPGTATHTKKLQLRVTYQGNFSSAEEFSAEFPKQLGKEGIAIVPRSQKAKNPLKDFLPSDAKWELNEYTAYHMQINQQSKEQMVAYLKNTHEKMGLLLGSSSAVQELTQELTGLGENISLIAIGNSTGEMLRKAGVQEFLQLDATNLPWL